MARHKTHYLTADQREADPPTPPCGATPRTLLPLLFSDAWPDVTCRRCRRQAPPMPLTPLQQLRHWLAGVLESAGARLRGGVR